jgi:hypothetical protein
MQRYTIFFIVVNALHVSGSYSAHHQELKIQNCTHKIWYMPSLFAASASGSSKQAWLEPHPHRTSATQTAAANQPDIQSWFSHLYTTTL